MREGRTLLNGAHSHNLSITNGLVSINYTENIMTPSRIPETAESGAVSGYDAHKITVPTESCETAGAPLHDDAPCLVVGGTVAAVCRAEALQKNTFTILLTPSELAVDPYAPAAHAAGLAWEQMTIRPADVLKPGTIIYGHLLEMREPYARIESDTGAQFELPVKAILLADDTLPIVNDIDKVFSRSEKHENDRSTEMTVTVAGSAGSAASTAIELIVASVARDVVWNIREIDVPPWWKIAVQTLGGRVDQEAHPDSATNPQATPVIPSQTDWYGRFIGTTCAFRLIEDNFLRPNDRLFENVLTCAVSTGWFPLSLKRLRPQSLRKQHQLLLSRRAKTALVRRGVMRWGIAQSGLEQRLKHVRRAIQVLRQRKI